MHILSLNDIFKFKIITCKSKSKFIMHKSLLEAGFLTPSCNTVFSAYILRFSVLFNDGRLER